MYQKVRILVITLLLLSSWFAHHAFAANTDMVTADIFEGDENYLLYPFDLVRLKRESVIVKYNDGQVFKVYRYNDKGYLASISLPEYNFSLLLDRYTPILRYFAITEKDAYICVGGNLSNINLGYKGGAGLSDAATESSCRDEIVAITKRSISEMDKAIREYEAVVGKRMTKGDFERTINIKHPLMVVNNMNLAFFFDGHGKRLQFNRIEQGGYEITSTTLAKDMELERQYAENDIAILRVLLPALIPIFSLVVDSLLVFLLVLLLLLFGVYKIWGKYKR